MSKVWLIKSDLHGTAKSASKELVYEFDKMDTTPDNYTFPIGEVTDHGDGGNIHSDDSPARYVSATPLISGVQISNLEGRLKTLADASFSDLEQRKAFKDMITGTLWNWHSDNECRVRETFDFLEKSK